MWEGVVCILQCYNIVCVYMHPLLVKLGLVCMLIHTSASASNLWCFKSHFHNSKAQLIVHCATLEGSAGHMVSSLLVCMPYRSQSNLFYLSIATSVHAGPSTDAPVALKHLLTATLLHGHDTATTYYTT